MSGVNCSFYVPQFVQSPSRSAALCAQFFSVPSVSFLLSVRLLAALTRARKTRLARKVRQDGDVNKTKAFE